LKTEKQKADKTTKRATYTNFFRRFVSAIFVLLIIFLSTVHLESVPPLSWDEGWTFSVARNWVEKGFYGRLLKGNPVPPGLEASVTVTMPAAFSFRLLGVGIWQGRIVGLLFLLGAVAFIYFLAWRLYDQAVATISIAALFLTAPIFWQWHPIVMARQALGEIPMLFFITAGYCCFHLTLSRSAWFMPMAVLLWATGAITKPQAYPFLIAALVLPLLMTIGSRQWRIARLIAGALLSCFLTTELLFWLQKLMLVQHGLPRSALPAIYSVVAFVPSLEIRWLALQVSLFLLPTILGLLYEARKSLNPSQWSSVKSDNDILRVTMLGFTVSWLGWYMLCSNAYPRYAFPVNFVGSIFVAKLLRDLIDSQVDVFAWKKTKTATFLRARISREQSLALLLIAVWSLSTVKMLYRVYVTERDESVKQVAQFLNTQTPTDSVIETYDSEIHFLLRRQYHFPPDRVHLDLIRRSFPGNYTKVSIDYDPLTADPDYLVVGDFIKGLRLYDPVLRTGAFHLIQSFNQYDIYKRAR
jgi:4-amino-4-deoxy-L-arabinose transferase-like glycosyltransferase